MTVKRTTGATAVLMAGVLALLGGCTMAPDRAPVEPVAAPKLMPPRVPEAMVFGEPRIRLPVAETPFLLTAAEQSDPLPAATVPETELYDTGLLEALETIFASARVPIAVLASPDVNTARLTLVQRRSIPLDRLLEQIAIDQGFFYSFRDGILSLKKERPFVVALPPIGGGAVMPASASPASGGGVPGAGGVPAAATNGNGGSGGSVKRIDEGIDVYSPIAEALTTLGASKVSHSRLNRTIVFNATRDRLPMIERFLNEMRARGKVVIVDSWIVDVQLSDGADVGIDWNKAAIEFGGGRELSFSGKNSMLDGFSLGFTGSFGRVSLDMLASFLATQGTAQTIASPRMVMLSGSRADFSQGENIPYIANVEVSQSDRSGNVLAGGSLVFANVGLAMSVVADAMNDTVYLGVGLRASSVRDYKKFDFGTVVQEAPLTAERTYSTEVRLPIGEAAVINGIRQSVDSVSKRHLPGVGEVLPLVAGRDTESRTRSELVIVLRPRVVEFVPQRAGAAPMAPPSRAPALPSLEDSPAAAPTAAPGELLDRELEHDRASPPPVRPSAPPVPLVPRAGAPTAARTETVPRSAGGNPLRTGASG